MNVRMMKLIHKELEKFRGDLYDNLIYSHHCMSKNKTLSREEFYDIDPKVISDVIVCDYYGVSDGDITTKYALDEPMIRSLPIRVIACKKLHSKTNNDLIHFPNEWKSFKVVPLKMHELKDIIPHFISPHTQPKDYELYVVLAFASLIGKCSFWVSTNHAFGKSSIFKTLNYVFDNVPVVERPRTVPSFYKYIPEDGVLVLDELSKKDSESSENVLFALNVMGDVNEPVLRMNTGGSAQYGTNIPKSLRNCSTVCIMNRKWDYKSEDQFAEYMFSNNKALDRRFLKFKPNDGQLDISYFTAYEPYNESHRKLLIEFAKTIAWYKPHYDKSKGEWVCGYKLDLDPKLVKAGLDYTQGKYQQTHFESMKLIIEILSIYCKGDPVKFGAMLDLLLTWITNYKTMLTLDEPPQVPVTFQKYEVESDTYNRLHNIEEELI